MHAGLLGLIAIFIVFSYTIYLVRADKLSAHLAMSWVIAEIVFLGIMFSDKTRIAIRSFLGEETAPYSLFLLGSIWIVYLILESLTRLSTLTVKLKEVTQEAALARERIDRAEEKILDHIQAK